MRFNDRFDLMQSRPAIVMQYKRYCYTNSTAIITDLQTVLADITAQQRARAIAAAGPMEDLDAMVSSLILGAQEMKAKIAYILGGTMTGGTSGGLIQTGDTAPGGTGYTTLVSVLNILS
jgi:hypothetical protein